MSDKKQPETEQPRQQNKGWSWGKWIIMIVLGVFSLFICWLYLSPEFICWLSLFPKQWATKKHIWLQLYLGALAVAGVVALCKPRIITSSPEKYFITRVLTTGITGGVFALLLPIAVKSTTTGVGGLRHSILLATGGLLAILTLGETRRKNDNDKLKNDQDKEKNDREHLRQVRADRRERYTKAVEQLGDEKAPIRMGGVYTLVGLVDEWLEDESIEKYEDRLKEGQVIVNNLCAYIRSPFTLASHYDELSNPTPTPKGIYKGKKEKFYADKATLDSEADVRLSIMKEIHDRLQGSGKNAPGAWSDFEYDFSGSTFFYPVDLTKSYYTKPINFSGSTYQGEANFSNSTYKGWANFTDSTYQGEANFSNSTYVGKADFSGSTYKKNVTFSTYTYNHRSTYKGEANFSVSTYEGEANFSGSIYEKDVTFGTSVLGAIFYKNCADHSGSTYKGRADFSGSTYKGRAYFSGSTYEKDVTFSTPIFRSTYVGKADFRGSTYVGEANFSSSTYEGEANFSGSTYEKDVTFGTSVLGAIFYKNCADHSGSTYKGRADFSGSTYKGRAYFSGSTYEKDVTFSTPIFRSTYVGKADFTDSIYKGRAYFTGSTYENETDFSGSIFCSDIYFGKDGDNSSFSRFAGCAPQFYDETNHKNTLFGSPDNDFSVENGEGHTIYRGFEGLPLSCAFLTAEQKEYLEDKFQEIDKTKNKLLEAKDEEENTQLLDTLGSLKKELHDWREKVTTVQVEGTASREEDN